jgi:hypothetical protein
MGYNTPEDATMNVTYLGFGADDLHHDSVRHYRGTGLQWQTRYLEPSPIARSTASASDLRRVGPDRQLGQERRQLAECNQITNHTYTSINRFELGRCMPTILRNDDYITINSVE